MVSEKNKLLKHLERRVLYGEMDREDRAILIILHTKAEKKLRERCDK